MKLDKLGVQYETVDLTEDSAARFRDENLLQAPVVEVDLGDGATWRWSGYSPSQIERLQKVLRGDDPQRVVAA